MKLIATKNSLSTRLVKFISLLIASIIIILSILYTFKDYNHQNKSVNDEIMVIAKIIEFNYSKLDYESNTNINGHYYSLQHILDSLHIQDAVNAAVITDNKGKSIAEYSDDTRVINIADPKTYNERIPILVAGKIVSYFYVDANYLELKSFLLTSFYSNLWILISSLFLSLVLVRTYIKYLCDPLTKLVNTFQKVIVPNEFSMQSNNEKSTDELYDLKNIFNVMLFKMKDNHVDDFTQNNTDNNIERKDTELQESYEKLQFAAYHDPLTLLPNVRLFKSVLEYRVKSAQINHTKFAVLFIDLDNFKQVNDSYGHGIGNELLKKTAKILVSTIRKVDFIGKNDLYQNVLPISRLGGDEFTIILNDIQNIEEVDQIADRLKHAVQNIKKIKDCNINVTLSIGIALYPEHGEDVALLLKHADAAMYHAKSAGKNKYEYYSEAIGVKISNKLKIEAQLSDAIINNEFILAYQPKFNINDNSLTGLEALIRWDHPEKGIIGPDSFINISEDSELICAIGDIVVDKICEDILYWRSLNMDYKKVSINISMRQFEKSDFVENFIAGITKHGVNPQSFEIELTESMLVSDFATAIYKLNKLKDHGVSIAIDDFGTGYSSFKYLSSLPIKHIKIDKIFIATMDTDPHSYLIVKTIVNLAHSLNMQIIAEGIETFNQIEILKSLNCDIGQGYYYCKPLFTEDLISYINKLNIADNDLMINNIY